MYLTSDRIENLYQSKLRASRTALIILLPIKFYMDRDYLLDRHWQGKDRRRSGPDLAYQRMPAALTQMS